MLYSPKQEEVLKFAISEDWQLLINHGATRSGKTTLDNSIFLRELRAASNKARRENKDPLYILSGDSLGAIEKNVLTELRSLYGLDIKLDKWNTFPLLGCRVCCFGHSQADDSENIRGMTAYGAYLNEMTTAHPDAFDEIQKRCSGRLRVLGDTNPDHPEHWLKKDYIDTADQKRIAQFHWSLEDNPFLDDAYVEGIKAITPQGMFYDRKIRGLWVTAEGVVYSAFDSKKHLVEDLSSYSFIKHWAAVDWGYEHWGVLQLWGKTKCGKTIMILESPAKHQEIDYWVNEAKEVNKFIGKNIPFFCDSARPEHIARFWREGLRAYNANKSVLSGIEEVAKLIKQDKLLIYKPRAELFRSQIYGYVWDKKSGMPVKKDDDSMDTMRYAIYSEKMSPMIV